MMIHSLMRLLTILAIVVTVTACQTSRTTTTPRTGVEQAIIAQSAEETLAQFAAPNLEGKKFTFDDSQFEATDKQFALSSLRLHLLRGGMIEVTKPEEADVVVRPRVAISGIDDSSFLIGVPAIPVIIPGAGSIELPELALLGKTKQSAKSRMGMYAVYQTGTPGALARDFGVKASRSHYARWKILFIFGFRHTDLREPYRSAAREKAE